MKYTKEMKLEAVKKYLSGEYGGYKVIARMYGFKDETSQIRDWVKKYKEEGKKAFEPKVRKKVKTEEETLKERVRLLELEVEFLKKLRALREQTKQNSK